MILETQFEYNPISMIASILCFLISFLSAKLICNANFKNIKSSQYLMMQFAILINYKILFFTKKEIKETKKQEILKNITDIILNHQSKCKQKINCKISKIKEYNNIDYIIKSYLKSMIVHRKDNSEVPSEIIYLKYLCMSIFIRLYEENQNSLLKKFFFLIMQQKRELKSFIYLSPLKFYLIIFELKFKSRLNEIETEALINLKNDLTINEAQGYILKFTLIKKYIKVFEDFINTINLLSETINHLMWKNYEE